jgi:hypothetical protein
MMKGAVRVGMVLVFLLGGFMENAHAATTEIEPPDSVVPGQLETDGVTYWFLEKQTTLVADLSVDITSEGGYTVGTGLTSGTIGSGTPVNSYLLHFDPAGEPANPKSSGGTIVFPYPILGIIVSDALLSNTDSILGHPDTAYPTDQKWRGLEFGTGSIPDSLYFNGAKEITQIFFASNAGVDQVRVITGVPIPASIILLGAGLLGFIGFRRRSAMK